MVQYPFVTDSPYAGRNLSVFTHNMGLPRHRWYDFKDGFSASLVAEAINSSAETTGAPSVRVLDPFGGSGTTALTATTSRYSATSVEVNPFLAFAARCKVTPMSWNKAEFERATNAFESVEVARSSPLEGYSTFSESGKSKKWLFSSEVLRTHHTLMHLADEFSPSLRDVLKLAVIGATMDVCNAKRDGKCLRYRKGWQNLSFGRTQLLERLLSRLGEISEDCETVPLTGGPSPLILNNDCRLATQDLPESSADLIVTSPPYLNSFDYSDVYRPEMFLSGFVRTTTELRDVRLQTIRSHVQVSWQKSQTYQSALLQSYVRQLRECADLWSARIPDMVQAYFDDMQLCLNEISRLCSPGAQVWFVVSTSAYGGVQIPVDLLLAEIGEQAGLRLDGIHILRRLRSSGQHWQGQGKKPPLRESLLIWRKPR